MIVTQEQLDKYRWYHHFKFEGGAETRPAVDCPDVWEHIENNLKYDFFNGKSVLDIGARDCYWALQAEKLGASKVLAIDITLNPGVAEIVLPYFNSRIQQRQMNCLDIELLDQTFDTILCFGLLYHIRYPFFLFNSILSVLKMGGELLIETAILARSEMEKMPLLWCPVKSSPYESTSCTFFNVGGLIETLESFGFTCLKVDRQFRKTNNPDGMDRAFFRFQKQREIDPFLDAYWNKTGSFEELEKLHK